MSGSVTALEHVLILTDGVEAVTNVVAGAGIRQLFFLDPNGVRLEINVKPVAAAG